MNDEERKELEETNRQVFVNATDIAEIKGRLRKLEEKENEQ